MQISWHNTFPVQPLGIFTRTGALQHVVAGMQLHLRKGDKGFRGASGGYFIVTNRYGL